MAFLRQCTATIVLLLSNSFVVNVVAQASNGGGNSVVTEYKKVNVGERNGVNKRERSSRDLSTTTPLVQSPTQMPTDQGPPELIQPYEHVPTFYPSRIKSAPPSFAKPKPPAKKSNTTAPFRYSPTQSPKLEQSSSEKNKNHTKIEIPVSTLPALNISFLLKSNGTVNQQLLRNILTDFVRGKVIAKQANDDNKPKAIVSLDTMILIDSKCPKQIVALTIGTWSCQNCTQPVPTGSLYLWIFGSTETRSSLHQTLEATGFSINSDSLTIQVNGETVAAPVLDHPRSEGKKYSSPNAANPTTAIAVPVLTIVFLSLLVIGVIFAKRGLIMKLKGSNVPPIDTLRGVLQEQVNQHHLEIKTVSSQSSRTCCLFGVDVAPPGAFEDNVSVSTASYGDLFEGPNMEQDSRWHPVNCDSM